MAQPTCSDRLRWGARGESSPPASRRHQAPEVHSRRGGAVAINGTGRRRENQARVGTALPSAATAVRSASAKALTSSSAVSQEHMSREAPPMKS